MENYPGVKLLPNNDRVVEFKNEKEIYYMVEKDGVMHLLNCKAQRLDTMDYLDIFQIGKSLLKDPKFLYTNLMNKRQIALEDFDFICDDESVLLQHNRSKKLVQINFFTMDSSCSIRVYSKDTVYDKDTLIIKDKDDFEKEEWLECNKSSLRAIIEKLEN